MTSKPLGSEQKYKMKCVICGKSFKKAEEQTKAQWAISWCETSRGFLCPLCDAAAKDLGGKDPHAIMRSLPWGSDIAEKSEAVSEEDYSKRRRSESWHVWNATNNPELYTDSEKEKLLG